MNYRILELIGPRKMIQEGRQIASEQSVLGVWSEELDEGEAKLSILMNVEQTEILSDVFSNKFSKVEGFNIMIYKVEAVLPQPEEPAGIDPVPGLPETERAIVGRISREELYADVSSGSELNRVYLGTVILSALVAGVGLLRDDVAVIIGAMVIAPLLGPNVSLALAATLADVGLGWKAIKSNVAGLLAALGVALMMGFIFNVNPESEQIMNRTVVGPGDIAVALAAGSAGVLAFTRGVPAIMIGVMVAVALLPPLMSIGLLLGAGYTNMAIGAAMLTVTNLICINLAGIVTFLMQGIRPRNWWEAEKAKRASQYAITLWVVLLLIFALMIWVWGQ